MVPLASAAASDVSAIRAWTVAERPRSRAHVGLPRAEVVLGVRFGSGIRGGLDVHAAGVRRAVLRKTVGAGQRAVFVRVPFGANRAVLGATPASITGHTVDLAGLWGRSRTQRLLERLHAAGPERASRILQDEVAERIARSDAAPHQRRLRAATALLEREHVGLVADRLGTSERHFRRVFRDALGVSPKVYARLRRFRRAVTTARRSEAPDWAAIAANAGYYDQAHLIADFRAIGGAAPRALLAELQAAEVW